MSQESSPKRAFHIGIAMSGAASAGAYTAGVFDFLIEALSEWHRAKELPGSIAPQHDVFISTLAGTSAGGITACLGLMSLAGGVRIREEPSVNPARPPIKRALPELYNVWVKDLRMFGVRGATENTPMTGNRSMLDTGDIKQGSMPNSLLNSDTLTSIARQGLRSISPSPQEGQKRPFFTDPTHLFLTRANLDGGPSALEFSNPGVGHNPFYLNLYEGRSHYQIKGLGSREFPNSSCTWLDQNLDHGTEVNICDLGQERGDDKSGSEMLDETFEGLVQATLATSAIPIVFAARKIAKPMDDGARLVALASLETRTGRMEGEVLTEGPRAQMEWDNSICTDGGSFNNDPFDVVRWTILDTNKKQNPRDSKTADRAVILISPFRGVAEPSDPGFDPDRQVGLAKICGMLLKAYLHHAKFKALDLAAAMNYDVRSRFMISPSHPHRKTGREHIEEKKDKPRAILATAALHHGAGFFDEQFREHDFQLGRRNCQRFLEKHFVLHPTNPVFGYTEDVAAAISYDLPIIPLFGTAAVPIAAPVWPQMPRDKLKELREAVAHRCDALVGAVTAKRVRTTPTLPETSTASLELTPLVRIAIRVWWWLRRKAFVNKAMAHVTAELENNGQLESVRPATDYWSRIHWSVWFAIGVILFVLVALVIHDRWIDRL